MHQGIALQDVKKERNSSTTRKLVEEMSLVQANPHNVIESTL
jgi:hypothetical protein